MHGLISKFFGFHRKKGAKLLSKLLLTILLLKMEILEKVKAFIDAKDSASLKEFVAENHLKNVSVISDAAVRALPFDQCFVSQAEAFLPDRHRLQINQNESITFAK